MILEHAPFGRRGFFASFTLQGVQAGHILAAAVFLPLALLIADEAFNPGFWRIPFLSASSSSSPATSFAAKSPKPPPSPKRRRAAIPRQRRSSRLSPSLGGHAARRLHGADECHPGRRDDFRRAPTPCSPPTASGSRRRLSVDPRRWQHSGRAGHPVRRQPGRHDRPQAADHRRRSGFRACCRSPISTRSASPACRSRSSSRC